VERLEPPARFDHVRGDVSVKAGAMALGHDDVEVDEALRRVG
jgi:hypothetical protein